MDSGQPDIVVAPMTEADWPSVREIYVQGMATGNATFEKSAPDYSVWDRDHLRVCPWPPEAGMKWLDGPPSAQCRDAASTAAWPR